MSLYARRVTLPAITPLVLQKRVIKVYSEDGTSRALEVPNDTTAVNVCQLLIEKNHYIDDQNWTLFEQLPTLRLERIIEDHELVIDVQSKWDMDEDCRFCFRKYYAKYEFFKSPEDPRHLQFFSDLSQTNIYMLLSTRKMYGAPTDYGFCLKPHKTGGAKEMKMLCAESEETKGCWVTAIRLYKHGKQIYQNYLRPHQKNDSNGHNLSAMRSISENSLVAMDFSGHKTRVIENPTEALSIAVQEGLLWRRKSCGRISAHGIPTSSQNSKLNIAVHMSQPWFHHKISRDEAQKLIHQQGLVNGVFLVRDSQSTPKSFVLSLCYGQKIKHFQILPIEDGGELFYTLDEGHTRFTDLTQLVEFHLLNRGILPCTLKHYCTRVTV
ncbi:growth factor receptor-bound protein 14 isoform 2-T2 [Anomaloglossus baeobatrachus]|uniref:growth factor receptor-bound protein 14 isoform X2 n=1 Tax=Anomaloglossus baeobatrachus TaxID=238106 RepID=UPI003F500F16